MKAKTPRRAATRKAATRRPTKAATKRATAKAATKKPAVKKTAAAAKPATKGRTAARTAARAAARRRPASRRPTVRATARPARRVAARKAAISPAQVLKEFIIETGNVEWAEKSLAGLHHKMLWRNEETGATIALVRFDQGSGIPDAHLHASNQFMFCLSGKYRYVPSGITLIPGSFYCNPKGAVHGPTVADETSIFLEMYDGPHYPVKPAWYTKEEDAH